MSERILVADDDLDYRTLCRIVLESAGYEVIEAKNSDECLRRAREEVPDLILLDVRMPRRSGWDCLGEIRSETTLARVPVIMTTAAAEPELERRAAAEGAAALIAKPSRPHKLVEAVRAHLPG